MRQRRVLAEGRRDRDVETARVHSTTGVDAFLRTVVRTAVQEVLEAVGAAKGERNIRNHIRNHDDSAETDARNSKA